MNTSRSSSPLSEFVAGLCYDYHQGISSSMPGSSDCCFILDIHFDNAKMVPGRMAQSTKPSTRQRRRVSRKGINANNDDDDSSSCRSPIGSATRWQSCCSQSPRETAEPTESTNTSSSRVADTVPKMPRRSRRNSSSSSTSHSTSKSLPGKQAKQGPEEDFPKLQHKAQGSSIEPTSSSRKLPRAAAA